MDKPPDSYRVFLAPSAAYTGGSRHLPGARDGWPSIEDHLVVPELGREERVRGRKVVAFPAQAPHGDRHARLDYVVSGHVIEGYVASTDLLTRSGQGSDFATDTCIRKDGIDSKTGDRYLEELAFEVVYKQSVKDITERAEDLVRRGVRRVFAIFVRKGEVREWASSWRRWKTLAPDTLIEDDCLELPIPAKALLEAAAADNAVARALAAKKNPVILEIEKRGRESGAVGERARALLDLLESREVEIADTDRQRILACRDLALLRRWFTRAARADSATEVFDEP